MDKTLDDFIRESNAIEGVYSERAVVDAKEAWEWLMTQSKMTPEVVKKVHYMLMAHSDAWERSLLREVHKYRGEYRDCPVWIGNQEAMSWHTIAIAVEEWCQEMNVDTFNWKELHIQYEGIHPFVDGNGRTGRMFMNWHRLKHCNKGLMVVWKKYVSDYYGWFI